MFIDTHAHVNFSAFKDDADEVIRRAFDNNTWMVLVGSELKTSNRALNYANKYEKGVYAAIGLHPVHLEEGLVDTGETGDLAGFTARAEEFDYGSYEKLAKFEKVVAIGEIGLDYYHLDPTKNLPALKKKQQEVFAQQLLLARSLDLPAIIHCRQAHDDLLMLLQEFKEEYGRLIPNDRPWGVVHCFSGDEDLAWKYFKLGLLISFTGLITFSQQWDDLIRKTSLDKIMIETDSPYMTPEPYRGQRNEPLLVQYVANHIAKIKNIKLEKVAEITTATARAFFKI
ncbi:TPA: hydrolase TatD [Candidatus Falkowbacteria bacterium]|nr:MAG: Hydrolase, TatD family [Candidatus Falkowbacteria bacterium GW2011_GWF2_43_32]HBA36607.1 hydrolase TatD [Candidatus Falkowbacteria bacterium]